MQCLTYLCNSVSVPESCMHHISLALGNLDYLMLVRLSWIYNDTVKNFLDFEKKYEDCYDKNTEVFPELQVCPGECEFQGIFRCLGQHASHNIKSRLCLTHNLCSQTCAQAGCFTLNVTAAPEALLT